MGWTGSCRLHVEKTRPVHTCKLPVSLLREGEQDHLCAQIERAWWSGVHARLTVQQHLMAISDHSSCEVLDMPVILLLFTVSLSQVQPRQRR